MSAPHLFCFGLGYSARVFARRQQAKGWAVSGTVRSTDSRDALAREGFTVHLFDDAHPLDESALDGVTHVLISIPPGEDGDPVLGALGDALAARSFDWVGYLSTTGVYGDTGGAAVREDAPCQPTQKRSIRRLAAEQAWAAVPELPVHIFRLAGIYGPGSSVLDKVRQGKTARVDKPGHKFGRIHVDDIANVLAASIARPNPGAVYNVTDDEPVEPATVTAYACELLGVPVEEAQPFEKVAATMSPMQRTFWADNRTVDNTRIHDELGVTLSHPTYREGIKAVLAAETDQA